MKILAVILDKSDCVYLFEDFQAGRNYRGLIAGRVCEILNAGKQMRLAIGNGYVMSYLRVDLIQKGD